MLPACLLWKTYMSATINVSLCATCIPGPECSDTAISFWNAPLSGASALEPTKNIAGAGRRFQFLRHARCEESRVAMSR